MMMAQDERGRAGPVGALLAAAGAVALCCAGPILLGVLATTGLGAALTHRGAPVVAAAGLIAALVVSGIVWQRRRACGCPVPSRTSRSEHSDETRDGFAPPRRDRTRVP